MIDGLKPYPKLKDSGVPWLGEVPEHWEARRLKYIFRRIVGGSTPSSAEATYWDGDIVWATPADVSKNSRLTDSQRRITREGLSACSTELVPSGSIVVTSRAPVGNVAIADVELCTNQGCKALVPALGVVDPTFGFHVLTTLKGELQSLATGTTFTEISTSRMGEVRVPLPPLPEQAAIVRFLDHVDRRIRRYIRAKQKLIKLLEELKAAIIHRAVTRGLDPNVRLKPSGVEWLGDVPEHWDVRLLGRCLERIDQGWSPVAAEGELAPNQWAVLTLSSVKRGTFDPTAIKPAPFSARVPAGIEIADGDLLLTRSNTRELVGDVCVARDVRPRTVICDLIYRLVPDAMAFNSAFLMYQLLSRAGRNQIERDARGSSGTMPKITQKHIRSWQVLVPPLYEQQSIAAAIGEMVTHTQLAASRMDHEIYLLREYRTRLIADVVTGKVDVREAAARLPDEAEEPEPLDEAEVESEAEESDARDTDEEREEAEA